MEEITENEFRVEAEKKQGRRGRKKNSTVQESNCINIEQSFTAVAAEDCDFDPNENSFSPLLDSFDSIPKDKKTRKKVTATTLPPPVAEDYDEYLLTPIPAPSSSTKNGSQKSQKKGKQSQKQSQKHSQKPSQKQILYEMFDYDYKSSGNGCATSAKSADSSYFQLSGKERAEFEKKISRPKNKSQEKYSRFLADKTKKIVIATGPAGTGKTLMATEYAIQQFVYGNFEKIIITRPSISVDEDLGYLPGTLEEKCNPYLVPIYDIFYRFFTVNELKNLIAEKIVEIAPLGFMRGRTFKNCCIIADEMQNSTVSQMKMILTRLGENSRVFITGDLEQKDLVGKINGLEDFLNKFRRGKRSSSIDSIEFEIKDVQREEVVKEVLNIYAAAETHYID